MLQEFWNFFGRAICHQIKDRSLQLSGTTLSVCARDTGIYIGIFSSLMYLHLYKRKRSITIPTIKVSFFLLLWMVPLIIDGFGSYAQLFNSSNSRRLLTGLCFGLVLPYFVYPLVQGKSLSQKSEPVVTHWKDILIPSFTCIILGLLTYYGALPYAFLDSLIIMTVITWFSLCAFCLLGQIHEKRQKSYLSISLSLMFLTFLSFLHNALL
ncbi:DUF2085 domain-containing protein [Neobacillus dielmonensis]|uniref:DUF2085 domain-containing protein n=1 Tax=Neobacillus dielmonensis TaxID=1347369 RepID=UPI000693860D|nr:DUF2085 domain-containing protein [Neobacillus dielmonensis]